MRWRFFVSEALNSIRGNAATTLAATVTVLIVTFLMGIFVTTGWWVYHYAVEKRNEVTVKLYLPPDYATSRKRYPVIYMHDGQNVFDDATSGFGEWGVDETLDGLFAKGGAGSTTLTRSSTARQRRTPNSPPSIPPSRLNRPSRCRRGHVLDETGRDDAAFVGTDGYPLT